MNHHHHVLGHPSSIRPTTHLFVNMTPAVQITVCLSIHILQKKSHFQHRFSANIWRRIIGKRLTGPYVIRILPNSMPLLPPLKIRLKKSDFYRRCTTSCRPTSNRTQWSISSLLDWSLRSTDLACEVAKLHAPPTQEWHRLPAKIADTRQTSTVCWRLNP